MYVYIYIYIYMRGAEIFRLPPPLPSPLPSLAPPAPRKGCAWGGGGRCIDAHAVCMRYGCIYVYCGLIYIYIYIYTHYMCVYVYT